LLTYSTVSHCKAKDASGSNAAGGGVFANGKLTLSKSTIYANTATSTVALALGGGTHSGQVNISYSTVSGNTASGSAPTNSSYGGGIDVRISGDSVISNSTIVGNHAYIGGGAASYHSGITLINSTLSGNTADKMASALYLEKASLKLENSTIAFNSDAAQQSAIVLSSHFYGASFTSSIIADNAGASIEVIDAHELIIAGSNNDIVGPATFATLPGDTLTTDPMLLPLGNNGGVTLTHAFRNGSPAFGAGSNPFNFTTDQRGSGFARTVNGATDIGAYEEQIRDRIFASGFE
jgi:hypothetical protein